MSSTRRCSMLIQNLVTQTNSLWRLQNSTAEEVASVRSSPSQTRLSKGIRIPGTALCTSPSQHLYVALCSCNCADPGLPAVRRGEGGEVLQDIQAAFACSLCNKDLKVASLDKLSDSALRCLKILMLVKHQLSLTSIVSRTLGRLDRNSCRDMHDRSNIAGL